jgi:dGTPase
LPQKYQVEKSELYGQLLNICQFISLLTDGKAIELYKIVNANKL